MPRKTREIDWEYLAQLQEKHRYKLKVLKTKVEAHPECKAIERDMMSGEFTYAQLQKKWSIGRGSLKKHRETRLMPRLKRTLKRRDDKKGLEAMAYLEELVGKTRTGLKTAVKLKDLDGTAKLIGRGNDQVELLAKLQQHPGFVPERQAQSAQPHHTTVQIVNALVLPKADEAPPLDPKPHTVDLDMLTGGVRESISASTDALSTAADSRVPIEVEQDSV